MIAIDTETNGKDLHHGCRPFFVTICDDKQNQTYYEWDVNPQTREVEVVESDLQEIRHTLDTADTVVGQNIKFDVHALRTIGIDPWHWNKTVCTLIAAHLIASNQKHDLTSLTLEYLSHDIKPLEDTLEKAVKKCRSLAKSRYPTWKIAKEEMEVLPSVKKSKGKKDVEGAGIWRADYWLPRAVAKAMKLPVPANNCEHIWRSDLTCSKCRGHQYWIVLRDYSNADSACTIEIWKRQQEELKAKGLWSIYQERMKVVPIAYRMEHRPTLPYGVSLNRSRLLELKKKYVEESKTAAATCNRIAAKYKHELKLPKSGNNHNLSHFIFECLKLPPEKKSKKTGKPSLDKDTLLHWSLSLPKSDALEFVNALQAKRNKDVCVSYLTGYERFMLPLRNYNASNKGEKGKEDSSGCQSGRCEGSNTQRGLRANPIDNDNDDTRRTTHNRRCSRTSTAPQLPYMEDGLGRTSQEVREQEEGNTERWRINQNWYVLHPNLNITGSDTLRWSSSSPNSQNFKKGDVDKGTSLRYCLGPLPGREWWSVDAQNIELRIPAYESGEQSLIELYERPNDPPFYGSNHLLNFSVVYPDVWSEALAKVGYAEVGPYCKKEYKDSYYQWVKNGDFCVPMDTLALTREGWKTYEELNIGDMVLGYDNGVLKWTPVLEKIRCDNAKLVQIQNNHFKATTTPEHRWKGKKRQFVNGVRQNVENFCTSDTISPDQTLYLSAPVQDETELPITDIEAALIGFAYSDGSVVKSQKGYGPSRGRDQQKIGFRVTLWQSKEKGIAWLKKTLDSWGKRYKIKGPNNSGVYGWDLDPEECRSIWKRAGLWGTQNFEEFVLRLGSSQRKAFLDAVYVAEGTIDGRGNTRLFSQNKGPFADAIVLAIFLCGKFPTKHDNKNYYGSEHTNLTIREGKPYVTGQRIKKTELDGLHSVWCIRTALHTWVMKQHDRIILTGNCLQYGGGEAKADATFRRIGAFRLLKRRFAKLEALNQKYIREANERGYVETLPDSKISPHRGYPLFFSRIQYGRVKPTLPFNYHVSGTAMWWTMCAMIECEAKLAEWRSRGFDGWIVLQVHDELVFDFPAIGDPRNDVDKSRKDGLKLFRTSNLWRVRALQRIMAGIGDRIGIPTPTGCELHRDSWGSGVTY